MRTAIKLHGGKMSFEDLGAFAARAWTERAVAEALVVLKGTHAEGADTSRYLPLQMVVAQGQGR